MIKKAIFHAMIPPYVRYSKTLSQNAKAFYGEITAHCNARGEMDFDSAEFAEFYGTDKHTMQALADELTFHGFIMQRFCEISTAYPQPKTVIRLMLDKLELAGLRDFKKIHSYYKGKSKTGEISLPEKEYKALYSAIKKALPGYVITYLSAKSSCIYCAGLTVYLEDGEGGEL